MALRYGSTAKVSTTTERLLKTSKKHNEQIRCACLILSTSLQTLLEPEIRVCCDGAVILLCVITRISSLWFSVNTCIYLLHKILSENQQIPNMPVRDARLSFVNSISALTSHPSTHTLVLYASYCSKVVVLAVHDIWSKTSFMCRLSFSPSAVTSNIAI